MSGLIDATPGVVNDNSVAAVPLGDETRRYCIVIDYTWSGVNEDTRRLSPDSMQFGHVLQRILQRMYDADPRHGPIYVMKVVWVWPQRMYLL